MLAFHKTIFVTLMLQSRRDNSRLEKPLHSQVKSRSAWVSDPDDPVRVALTCAFDRELTFYCIIIFDHPERAFVSS